MDKSEQSKLMKDDAREEKELRSYVARALAANMVNSIPGGSQGGAPGSASTTPADEVKTPAGRESGTAEWIESRGESGVNAQDPNELHDRR